MYGFEFGKKVEKIVEGITNWKNIFIRLNTQILFNFIY